MDTVTWGDGNLIGVEMTFVTDKTNPKYRILLEIYLRFFSCTWYTDAFDSESTPGYSTYLHYVYAIMLAYGTLKSPRLEACDWRWKHVRFYSPFPAIILHYTMVFVV